MAGTVSVAPTELVLVFSEGLNLKFTGVSVTGPGKQSVPTGDAALAADADSTLTVPLTAPMSPGSYLIKWHALAKDGHKTEGSYTFTVKP